MNCYVGIVYIEIELKVNKFVQIEVEKTRFSLAECPTMAGNDTPCIGVPINFVVINC